MEPIYAYHITDISNIKSTLFNGLIPSIGENSRQVHEHSFLTYFTTINNIKLWIKRFNLDKSKINLPVTLYDDNNNSYNKLDNTSPTNTWLNISN